MAMILIGDSYKIKARFLKSPNLKFQYHILKKKDNINKGDRNMKTGCVEVMNK